MPHGPGGICKRLTGAFPNSARTSTAECPRSNLLRAFSHKTRRTNEGPPSLSRRIRTSCARVFPPPPPRGAQNLSRIPFLLARRKTPGFVPESNATSPRTHADRVPVTSVGRVGNVDCVASARGSGPCGTYSSSTRNSPFGICWRKFPVAAPSDVSHGAPWQKERIFKFRQHQKCLQLRCWCFKQPAGRRLRDGGPTMDPRSRGRRPEAYGLPHAGPFTSGLRPGRPGPLVVCAALRVFRIYASSDPEERFRPAAAGSGVHASLRNFFGSPFLLLPS